MRNKLLQQLQKPYTVEIILALDADKWQSATDIYNQVDAALQTKIRRLNELIDLQIAVEKQEPPNTFARRRQLKLDQRAIKLQKLLRSTHEKLIKETERISAE